MALPTLRCCSERPFTPDSSRKTVAVLMSGGVDSSVTALLLQQDGWNVVGVTMQCAAAADAHDPRFSDYGRATSICRQLDMPHYILDASDAFTREVIEPFVAAYRQGRTPNPCVMCNPVMKFGLLCDVIRETLNIEDVATGHYAQILRENDTVYLARGINETRDQSYFLYRLPRALLPHLHFPLGAFREKDEVRALARDAGLSVAETADSQDICFLPDGNYRDILDTATGEPGPIFDMDGHVLGEHKGIEHYTIGQRRFLGVAVGKPMYVLRIDPETRAVVIGDRDQTYRKKVVAEMPNVLQPGRWRAGERLRGKIRSMGAPKPCTIEDATASSLRVCFDEALFAPTPGQHLVLWDEADRVVGGGMITDAQLSLQD